MAPMAGLTLYEARLRPDRQGAGSSLKTVEYAYDDWTIARMARAMGRADVAAAFEKRAGNWRNSFDAKTGFLRARKSDGTYRTPFDPTAINYGSDYTEGNAWQYSWFVPQDQGRHVRAARRRRGGGAEARRDVRFRQFEARLQPCGGHCRADRPVHPTATSRATTSPISTAMPASPWRTQERAEADRRQPVQADAGRACRAMTISARCRPGSSSLLLGFYPVAPGSNELC